MENNDFQTTDACNFWPGFSDMFLVLFVIVMVAFGTYKAQQKGAQEQDYAVEQAANDLFKLIKSGQQYNLFDDKDTDMNLKPVLASEFAYTADYIRKELNLPKDIFNYSVNISRKDYRQAIRDLGGFVNIRGKDYEDLVEQKPDVQIHTICSRLATTISDKIEGVTEKEPLSIERDSEILRIVVDYLRERGISCSTPSLTKRELGEAIVHMHSDLAVLKKRYNALTNGVVPASELKAYTDIFGMLPSDPKVLVSLKERWQQVKNLYGVETNGKGGMLVLVDDQFKKALEMFIEATDGRTKAIETPEVVAAAMAQLANSITGGQFDIVNSMLKDSEVKFESGRPSYPLINSINSLSDIYRVYSGDKPVFADQNQWMTAQKALIDKVVVGCDVNFGNTRKHSKGIVEMLKDHPGQKITVDITGYTDEDGTQTDNNDLGMRRAFFIYKVIDLLLEQELSQYGLTVNDRSRVSYRYFSSGEFNLPFREPGESLQSYKARCRCISITVKVDAQNRHDITD